MRMHAAAHRIERPFITGRALMQQPLRSMALFTAEDRVRPDLERDRSHFVSREASCSRRAPASKQRHGGRMLQMETAKEQVQQILDQLPQDASLEDIQYHIYVRQKIEQGLADAEEGRVVSHAEVQQRLAKWLTK